MVAVIVALAALAEIGFSVALVYGLPFPFGIVSSNLLLVPILSFGMGFLTLGIAQLCALRR